MLHKKLDDKIIFKKSNIRITKVQKSIYIYDKRIVLYNNLLIEIKKMLSILLLKLNY